MIALLTVIRGTIPWLDSSDNPGLPAWNGNAYFLILTTSLTTYNVNRIGQSVKYTQEASSTWSIDTSPCVRIKQDLNFTGHMCTWVACQVDQAASMVIAMFAQSSSSSFGLILYPPPDWVHEVLRGYPEPYRQKRWPRSAASSKGSIKMKDLSNMHPTLFLIDADMVCTRQACITLHACLERSGVITMRQVIKGSQPTCRCTDLLTQRMWMRNCSAWAVRPEATRPSVPKSDKQIREVAYRSTPYQQLRAIGGGEGFSVYW